MSKKLKAKHVTLFAVYKRFCTTGLQGRYIMAAFPNRSDAENWLNSHLMHNNFLDRTNYMIEEISATMKSWTP